LRRQLYDEDDPRTAKTRSNLVLVLTRLGDPQAVPLAEEALADRRRRLGAEHPQIGHALANLGEALYRAGRIDEGMATFRESIAHAEKSLGPEHPNVAFPVARLGTILVEQGRAEEAEPLLRRALAIREASMTEDAPLVSRSRADLADCLRALGRSGTDYESGRG
jgi:serine/threonine-protein kinase